MRRLHHVSAWPSYLERCTGSSFLPGDKCVTLSVTRLTGKQCSWSDLTFLLVLSLPSQTILTFPAFTYVIYLELWTDDSHRISGWNTLPYSKAQAALIRNRNVHCMLGSYHDHLYRLICKILFYRITREVFEQWMMTNRYSKYILHPHMELFFLNYCCLSRQDFSV